MFKIIICVVLTALVFVGLCFNFEQDGFVFRKRSLLALLVPVLFFGTSCYTFVEANNVGIQYNPFNGGVSSEVLSEGFVLKSPFTKIYQLSTEVQTKTIVGLTTQTKDSQFVTNDLDIKYKVNVTDAYQVFKQYRTMDNISESLIAPTVQRAIETVTVEFNIIEVLGSERNAVYANIEKELDKRFNGTGITVVSITFTDTDGGAEIENAIKAEAVAAKKVDQAEQEKLAAQVKAEQQIIEAEAKKKVAILEAEAQAESVRIIQEELSKNKTYIDYIKWSKWNGQLPQVMSDANSIVDLN